MNTFYFSKFRKAIAVLNFISIISTVVLFTTKISSAQGFNSVSNLTSLPVTAITGEKPQSKVWTNAGKWWMVMPDSTGTHVWRLDGTTWTSVLDIDASQASFADCKAVGNVTHILLYKGTSSSLVSVEYVPASTTYQLWSTRTSTVAISLDSGVETAAIDMDGNGRMWLASAGTNDINVRWSDSPYSSWSAAINLATGVTDDDICALTAFDGKIGVLWSNQTTQRFGFRYHADGAAAGTWSADEVPASQSAVIGSGMADDHINLAVASDGTIYAAVKTSFNDFGSGLPQIALLIRRPAGTWDNLYEIATVGTRPIVILNESAGKVKVLYTSSDSGGNILYKESSTSSISFSAVITLISGTYNNTTSTKQNYTGDIVIMASSASTLVGVLASDAAGAAPSAPNLISPGDVSTGITLSPTLSWNASATATSYQVQVSTVSNFATTVYNQSGIATTSTNVNPALLNNNLYYWRVNATNANGTSSFSTTWSFTTISSTPGIEDNGAGYALDFDGVNGASTTDYVNCGNGSSLNITQSLTMEAWIKPTAQRTHSIVKKFLTGGIVGYELFLANNAQRQVSVRLNNSASYRVNSTTPYPIDGSWMHVAATYDYSTKEIKLYVNGIQEGGTLAGPASIASTTNPLTIGSELSDFSKAFQGSIDEVRVWNIVRSDADIKSNMTKKLIGNESGLVGYWRFDETSGTSMNDETSNNNDGTMVNMDAGTDHIWSGAALGDASAYDYLATGGYTVTLNHANGDALTATTTAGTITGIQVYRADDNAIRSGSTGLVGYSLDASRFWGVRAIGTATPTYTLVYNYTGNPAVISESGLKLVKRDNISVGAWTDASATLDMAANTLTVTGATGTEYALAIPAATPPAAPTLISPADASTGIALSPTLSWNSSAGANTYQVQVSTSSGFGTTVFNQSAIAGTSVAVSPALANSTVYYWRVNATNIDGTSGWSPVWSFTTISLSSGIEDNGAGYALDFDGTNDYIDCGNNPSIQISGTAITMEAWIKPTKVGTMSILKKCGIIGGGTGYELYCGSAGFVYCRFNGNDASRALSTTSYPSTGAWIHVAATYDGVNTKMYINGVLEGTTAFTAAIVNSTNILEIANDPSTAARFFQGSIDEVRLWNVARTDADIKSNMTKKLIGNESGLVGYWRFDETSGTSMNDETSNNNDGTMINMDAGTDHLWSGAALGDASAYDYVAAGGYTATLNHANGDALTATTTSGTISGIQVYRADDNAIRSGSTGLVGYSLDASRFWGVRAIGTATPTYTLVYNYTGNPAVISESGLKLVKRDNISVGAWTDASATLDMGANTLTVTGATGTEYALAIPAATPPAAPTLISPADASTGIALSPTLSWNASAGANTYQVQVSTSSGFGTTVFNQSAIAGTSVAVSPALANSTVYYWRVNATNTDGTSSWSPVWSFTTIGTGPVTLVLQDGLNGYSGTRDTYIWETSPGTVRGAETTFIQDKNPADVPPNERKALLLFDLSSIPPGATIQSAELQFYVDAEGQGFNMHRMLTSWDEATVSYTSLGGRHFLPDNIDAESSVNSIWPGVDTYTGYITVSVPASTIQDWIDGNLTNNGWLMIAIHADDGQQLRSREHASQADRPKLTVTYSTSSGPSINISGTPLSAFNSQTGTPSASQSYTVSGSNLTDSILITAPLNFEISTLPASNFSSSITLHPSGGSVASTTIYVRFNRASAGSSSGNIQHTSIGAVTQNVAVTGTASTPASSIVLQDGLNAYSGTRDTYIYDVDPTITHGADTSFIQDKNPGNTPPDDRTSLLLFDLSSIPSGAIITSAELQFYVGVEGQGFNMYRMLVPWNEATASFASIGNRHFAADNVDAETAINANWPGVDTYVGSITVPVPASTIQDWIDGNLTNNGWLMIATHADDGQQLRSREHPVQADRPKLTINYSLVPSQAPNQPTNPSPADLANSGSTSPNICATVSDPNGDALLVQFYGRPKNGTGAKFAIVGLPDTQFYTEEPQGQNSGGGGKNGIFRSQTQWVADHRIDSNIVFVSHLGDCAQNGDANLIEWQRADTSMKNLEYPNVPIADGVPYGICVGNHDQGPIGNPDGTTTYYTQFFGSRFNGRAYYGGHYGSNNDNHFQLFSGGGIDFINISIEYYANGTTASMQPVLNWADSLLKKYSNRKGIISSHNILGTGNPGAFQGPGQKIYDDLKDNPNFILMLAGHVPGEGRRSDTYLGNTVHTLMSDYQSGYTNGGNGYLRFMQFLPDQNLLSVKTYSPYSNTSFTGASSQFTLPVNLTSEFVLLGTNTNVPSGSVSCIQWPSLTEGVEYEWYMVVSDGDSSTTGPVWSFTATGSTPPQVTTHPVSQAKCEGDLVSFTSAASGDPTPTVQWQLSTNGGVNWNNILAAVNATLSFTTSASDHGNQYRAIFTNAYGADTSNAATLTISGLASTSSTSITDCDSYTWNGVTYTSSGVYTTTGLNNAAGCDSSATVVLTINNSTHNSNTVYDCVSYTWASGNGITYTSSGTYLYSYTNGAGCASMDTLHLTISANSTSSTSVTACNTYTWNGVAHTTSGTYTTTGLLTLSGCDSSATVVLTINSCSSSALTFVPASQQYLNLGNDPSLHLTNFTLEAWIKIEGPGVSVTSGSGGVDIAPILAKGKGEVEDPVKDENYIFGYNAAANKLAADFEDNTNSNNHPVISRSTLGTCWTHVAASYNVPLHTWKLYINGILDTTLVLDSIYVPQSLSNVNGCIGSTLSSTGTLEGFFAGKIDEVRIWNVVRTDAEIFANYNAELLTGTGLAARWGLNEGSGSVAANSVAGGPSAILVSSPAWTLGFDAGANTSSSTPITACDSYTWNGITHTSSGTYTTTGFTNAGGCDSSATVVLTLNSLHNSSSITECTSYTWAAGTGTTYTSSGTYLYNYTNAGCASTDTLHLIIDGNPTSSTTVTACDSYTWNGVTYTTSGTYTTNGLTGTGGCDSSATVVLTINTCPTSFSVALLPANSQLVDLGNDASLHLTNFTLEAWIKIEGTGVVTSSGNGGLANIVPIISKGKAEAETAAQDVNYIFGYDLTTKKLNADFEDNAASGNHPVTGNAVLGNCWTHVAASYDVALHTWKLYVNGVLDQTLILGASYTPQSLSNVKACIGSSFISTGAATGYFAGRIDEVRIWNVVRSDAEILANYNLELSSGTGLASRWGFNEGTGIVASNSVGAAPVANLVNTPSWAAGFDEALSGASNLDFNGTSDYVSFGAASPALNASTFTLEAWIKIEGTGVTTTTSGAGGGGFEGTTAAVPIVTKGRGEAESPANVNMNYFMGLVGNKLAADFEEGTGPNHSVIGNATIPSNTWTHVAATYEPVNAVWNLYINGVLDKTLDIGSNIVPANTSIQHAAIGSALTSAGAAAGFFNGKIDEVRIWNVERTPAEILTNYGIELTGGTGLLGRWSFNEGCGLTAGNTVNGGVNGTLSSITGPIWVSGNFISPPIVVTDPLSQSVCEGEDVYFFSDASGDPAPTVQWQVSTNGGLNWSDILNANNPDLIFTTSASDNGKKYRAIWSNTVGSDTSVVVDLEVNPSTFNSTTTSACDSYMWGVNGQTYNASGTFTDLVGCHTEELVLTIRNSSTSSSIVDVCDSYTWNGTTYTASGVYTYSTLNEAGCDSTATLNLTIRNSSTSSATEDVCDSYTWNGTTYTASGVYTNSTTNAAGCDSTATLNLTIRNSSTSSATEDVCDSYTWNGTTYTASGVYAFSSTNAAGCDSTATLNLTIRYGTTSSSTVDVCDSYTWNGTTYTASGVYTYSSTNAAGCDSIATLNLTIRYATTSSSTVDVCDSYTWNGTTYTASGVYAFSSTNAAGCDSTATLNLTIRYATTSSSTVDVCDSYTWNGTTYTASGVYTYSSTNAAGCDSTATLNLTIRYATTSSSTVDVCDSYTWNGTTYTASGVYTYSSTNAAGCDSTATLNLTIRYATTSSSTVDVCDSYTWNGTTYTASGVYAFGSTNAAGCDSTATLNLTIRYATTSSSTVDVCDSYSWNGTTYTASGVYTYSSTNAAGCDSTATLNLTIRYATTSSSTVDVCDSYTWNGTTYTASGVYTFSSTNAAGCDSTATLNLTIRYATTSSSTVDVCDSYTWNGTTYTASGVYAFGSTNAAGCDSTATLNLTIRYATTSSSTVDVCDSYSWNGTTYTASGVYTYSSTNAAGCDSTATLNLTIRYATTSSSTVDVCDSYTWNGTTYTASGVYTFSSTNAAGCDSTATLNLTIRYATTSSSTVDVCDSYTWNGNTYSASGVYTYSTLNEAGCDSTATLNLTIRYATTSSSTVDVCDSYTWNGTTYTASGVYTFSSTNAAGCDSTATLNLTIRYATTSSSTVDVCDSYTWNGNTYSASGVYTYSTLNEAGCDSTATLNLTIRNSSTSSATEDVCDSYTWNGTTYTASGVYTYSTTNAAGCDSTATLNLTIRYATTSSSTVDVCDSYTWNGTTYTASGVYTYSTLNAAGCDSTATLNLTIRYATTSSSTIDVCDSYTWNGTTYTASGVYTYSTLNAAGCDSTATLNLTIRNSSTSSSTVDICDSYTWNGNTYSASGVYTYSTLNAAGCDSTATLNLTIRYATTSSSTVDVCDSYTWNGTNYTASGVYTFSSTNAAGCDSTATLNLTIRYATTSSSTVDVCDSYTWNGTTYTASGVYTFSSTNAAGCDSTATLNLTIRNSSTSSSTVDVCDSYTWNGTTYTSSGVYTYSTTNAAGCDSTATLNLTIRNSSTSSSTVDVCDSYTWNGTTYTSSGVYTYSTLNAAGCDSTATLNLTIRYATTSSSTVDVCDSYTWNGTTYTSSGVYTYSTTNAAGCDSTATLNLTIRNSSTSSSTVDVCDSYSWNGTTYTSSGVYTYSTLNEAGCDSTATLNLTIRYATTSSSTVDVCDSYSWNGTTYTSSGVYTYSKLNEAGCDSTATLNLTIRYATTSSSTVDVCDSYSWNGTTYTSSGVYTYSTTNAAGCDSTATLNLTIRYATTSSSTVDVCDNYSWNGTTYTSSGVYTFSSTNAAGCDSTATLNLTIRHATTSSSTVDVCDSYTWNGTTYTASGIYTYSTLNTAGCDSTATLNLTIRTATTSSSTVDVCDSYTWNGTTYTSSGTYTYSTLNAAGCDSTATLNLTIRYATASSSTVDVCDSYTWNGTTYISSGTYTYSTLNAAGCDSTATLNLTIRYATTSSTTEDVCDSYTWNGTTYTSSGTYTYSTLNAAGCDSTATLNLTIRYATASSSTVDVCDSYTWNGTTYISSGTYTYSTLNAAGCDSTATLNLTIRNSSTSSSTMDVCDSYSWNGTTYNASGVYTYSTTNAAGCDSTATLNLTIRYATTSSSTVDVCDSYTWNGNTYSASGVYTYSTLNEAGCDSTATLNLTIRNSSTSSATEDVCDSYTWNGTTYTASGVYTYSSTNAAGCDSTATLNLTIRSATTSSSTVDVCDSYTWNGTTYTSSGVYTYSSTNAAGCDSTATLNLTIRYATTSSSTVDVCDSYTWNGTTYTASGVYTYSSTNAAGCDSTATLNLTIRNSTSSTETITATNSYTWAVNGITYTTSGTYTHTGVNLAGCAHVSTLILTIDISGVNLDLKLFLEGYIISSGPTMMFSTLYDLEQGGILTGPYSPDATDTIQVNLWTAASISLGNLDPDYSEQVILHNNGSASVNFATAPAGNYYIAVKHKSSIETWSSIEVALSSTAVLYDFSDLITRAYDDGTKPPMQNVGGVFAFYSGDVNQDGTVDAVDMNYVYNDNNLSLYDYLLTDCTGDGTADATDMNYVYNNNNLSLYYARPY